MIFIDPKLWAVASGTPIGNVAVGDIIQLRENLVPVDYIVVHQGLPSSMYDASCDGAWLLRKDIAEKREWNDTNVNDYKNSTINSYLNSTYLNRFDPDVQGAIKQVKIPYRKGSGYGKTVTSGASGLSAKIFLLSSTEVSFNHDYMPTNEGAELSYFAGCADNGADNKRIAYLNSSATNWWLRSPYCHSSGGSARALAVDYNGGWGNGTCSYPLGIRPALVLPSDFLI